MLAFSRARYLLRGGLPMLVPLLAFPEVYRRTAEDLIGLFDPASSAGQDLAFSPALRLLAGAAFAASALAAVVLGRLGTRSPADRRAWREDAFETALLGALFVFVPPVLAVGLYFCLWHSARFVARLMLLDASSPLRKGRLFPALGRFFRDAAPLTAVALAMLVGLYFVVPESPRGLDAALALYLVLISALTLPHVAIVQWMDHEENLLSRRTRTPPSGDTG